MRGRGLWGKRKRRFVDVDRADNREVGCECHAGWNDAEPVGAVDDFVDVDGHARKHHAGTCRREVVIGEWPGAVHFSDVELFVDAVFFADFAFWSAAGPEWSVEGVDGGHFAHADFAVDECRRAFHEAEDVGEVVFDAGEVEFVEDDEVARCGVAVHEEFDVGVECDERSLCGVIEPGEWIVVAPYLLGFGPIGAHGEEGDAVFHRRVEVRRFEDVFAPDVVGRFDVDVGVAIVAQEIGNDAIFGERDFLCLCRRFATER